MTHLFKKKRIDSFNFKPNRILAGKYKVIKQLGTGWEGEVYLLKEIPTGIERAAKFFYPHRNLKNKTLTRYAQKLHKLRHCPIIIHYHNQDKIIFRSTPISFLVSEYVEGEMLSTFLERQPGKRLHAFQALHLLHAMATGMEQVHKLREYHGDLHTDNIIIQRFGLGFDLKLLDFYYWKDITPQNIQDDVNDLIRIFYDALGGNKHYAKQPKSIKNICCGLKKSLIKNKFRTAGQLKVAIENLLWE